MPAAGPNWGDRLARARTRLEQAGIAEADNKLRWVAGHLLGCGLLEVRRHLAVVPAPEMAARFEAMAARLEQDEPVQYVIGETDFMGLRIRCDARALIPRPETELLVQCAEDFLRTRSGIPVVVDVGTGTGCIACTLARRVRSARVLATDLSADALELARSNAMALGVFVTFRQSDQLAGLADASVDLVVSNPPYVRTAECDQLPRTIRDFEPRLALDGGTDGLRAISRLVSEAARVIFPGGRLMLEIGEDQADAVQELLSAKALFRCLEIKSDFAGNPRLALAERNPR